MAYDPLDFTEPRVCVDEHITSDDAGLLYPQPWSVPRLVIDAKGISTADGTMYPETTLPGKLCIEIKDHWRNTTPLESMLLVRVVRGPRAWLVSNPNAIQFRDRWTYTMDPDNITPEEPVTTGIYDTQVGSAIDVGTNSVAEPNPGRQWCWADVQMQDRWIGPLQPGERFNIWYRCYVWTPPPYSNNGNKNSPQHLAYASYSRVQVIAFAPQGSLVTG